MLYYQYGHDELALAHDRVATQRRRPVPVAVADKPGISLDLQLEAAAVAALEAAALRQGMWTPFIMSATMMLKGQNMDTIFIHDNTWFDGPIII